MAALLGLGELGRQSLGGGSLSSGGVPAPDLLAGDRVETLVDDRVEPVASLLHVPLHDASVPPAPDGRDPGEQSVDDGRRPEVNAGVTPSTGVSASRSTSSPPPCMRLSPTLPDGDVLAGMAAGAPQPIESLLRRLRNDLSHGNRDHDERSLRPWVALVETICRAHALRLLGFDDAAIVAGMAAPSAPPRPDSASDAESAP